MAVIQIKTEREKLKEFLDQQGWLVEDSPDKTPMTLEEALMIIAYQLNLIREILLKDNKDAKS